MSNEKVQKLNQFFYMNSKGDILKYKKYCIINNCKKLLLLIIREKKNFYIVTNINVKIWLMLKKVIYIVMFIKYLI